MNTMVALPIVAATPTTAPTMNYDRGLRLDSELIHLGCEFERLLEIEQPLKRKSSRLYRATKKRREELLGISPNDREARHKFARERWEEWSSAWETASLEVGYGKAAKRWNDANKKTAKVATQITKLKPKTTVGLLIKARVIETHDFVVRDPATYLQMTIKEFTGFA